MRISEERAPEPSARFCWKFKDSVLIRLAYPRKLSRTVNVIRSSLIDEHFGLSSPLTDSARPRSQVKERQSSSDLSLGPLAGWRTAALGHAVDIILQLVDDLVLTLDLSGERIIDQLDHRGDDSGKPKDRAEDPFG